MDHFLFFLLASSVVKISGAENITFSSKMIKNLPKNMKAVGLYKYLPLSEADSLVDLEVSLPDLRRNDVLVEVKAIAVNHIDIKMRASKLYVEKWPRILGYDGSGVVVAKGENASTKIGEEVIFAGDLRRNGSNAQYVALDEILVTQKPKNLNFEQAAAMPLTSVTAYESLYDRLLLSEKDRGKTLLVINSAGGVGSVATQIAKTLGLKVIGTASRPETEAFTRQNGAEIVLNHTQNLAPQLEAHGFKNGVDFILVNYDPYPYWDTLMKIIKPQGKICLIVDSSGLVDLRPLKEKSITLVSEAMFVRIKYDTEDKYRLKEILQETAKMLEVGTLKTTLTKTLSPINAANLKEAHRLVGERHMVGKLVLSGF